MDFKNRLLGGAVFLFLIGFAGGAGLLLIPGGAVRTGVAIGTLFLGSAAAFLWVGIIWKKLKEAVKLAADHIRNEGLDEGEKEFFGDFAGASERIKRLMKNVARDSMDVHMNSGALEITFDNFVLIIRDLVKGIAVISQDMEKQKEAVETTSAAVLELLRSVDSVASNTETQASSIIELSSTMEEMSASISNVAKTADTAEGIARSLVEEAETGSNTMAETIRSIREIKESSDKIKEITDVITDISSRTNLLAMNAAIEAAHAGQYGKGFAVVASEIRKLAESTGKSATEITTIIATVMRKIDLSSEMSGQIDSVFRKILGDIQETRKIIAEIASAVTEQAKGSAEIVDAVSDLVNITEEVRSALREQRSANQEIHGVIGNLEQITLDVTRIVREHNEKRFIMLDAVNRLGKVVVRNFDSALKIKNAVKEAV